MLSGFFFTIFIQIQCTDPLKVTMSKNEKYIIHKSEKF